MLKSYFWKTSSCAVRSKCIWIMSFVDFSRIHNIWKHLSISSAFFVKLPKVNCRLTMNFSCWKIKQSLQLQLWRLYGSTSIHNSPHYGKIQSVFQYIFNFAFSKPVLVNKPTVRNPSLNVVVFFEKKFFPLYIKYFDVVKA